MSTTDYYDYYSSSTGSTSSTGTTGTTEGPVDGSECLNYVYLVWVYFLFYTGAGYPTSYYPYIIATLLDTVPQECGGTGGQTEGVSLLSSSALTVLSLQQYSASPTFNGFIGAEAQYSSGSYSGGGSSLAGYGIQEPQLLGRRRRKAGRRGKWKTARKMGNLEKRLKENKKRDGGQGKVGRKGKTRNEQRTIETKEARKLVRMKQRKEERRKDKAEEKEERKADRSKKRRKQRKMSVDANKKTRKQNRKRQRKMKRIEESRLGRSLPSKKIKEFQNNFSKGKQKLGGQASWRFLKTVKNPFQKTGRLRPDFRSIVRKKVLRVLPDYCEAARAERSSSQEKSSSQERSSSQEKSDCARRADRIRERVRGRV